MVVENVNMAEGGLKGSRSAEGKGCVRKLSETCCTVLFVIQDHLGSTGNEKIISNSSLLISSSAVHVNYYKVVIKFMAVKQVHISQWLPVF